jgi:ABC-type transport system substrate-binding protein
MALLYGPHSGFANLARFRLPESDSLYEEARALPDGRPLLLKMASTPSADDRQYQELWKRSLDSIGVKVEFNVQRWPDLLKAARLGQIQAWQLGNINTTPEGFGFMALLYGPHSGFANLARFRLPESDSLYEEARALPDGAARNQKTRRMNELFNAYMPWVLTAFRYENVLVQPWLRGYKQNTTWQYPFAYLDIDRSGSNAPAADAATAEPRPSRAAAGSQ